MADILKDKRPPKQISRRWPGAGSQGVRRAIVTNRNKKLKVTLAPTEGMATHEQSDLPRPRSKR